MKFIRIAALTLLTGATALLPASEPAITPRYAAEQFPANQVTLDASPFKSAQDKSFAYLLTVDPDRLLARERTSAGLQAKAEQYGGWEGMSIVGHSLGHYLSACAKSYAATGDERFRERAEYIVRELSECQESAGTGMIVGDEAIKNCFAEISRGDVRSQGFDLNGQWVPWYTVHKIFAGLLDAYRLCGDELALTVAKRLADWGIETTSGLTRDQFQLMLKCEYGGMNDAYYQLYAITGDDRYLAQGDRFYDDAVLKPLNEGRDELEGRHANTQVPKIVGQAYRAAVAQDNPDDGIRRFELADFFWHRVTGWHSYAIGGNSLSEHFGKPGIISSRLGENSCETCNTYNMLKLTQSLYMQTGNPEYLDFYERAVTNHVLASINPRHDEPDALYTYFVPSGPGEMRRWSTREEDWTCCHGTGMENHAQYNTAIFYHAQEPDEQGGVRDVLYVNLLIPSTLHWPEKGIDVVVKDGSIVVESSQDVDLDVMVRRPRNTTGCDEYYWTVGEHWTKDGRVEKEYPFVSEWVWEPTPDNPNVAALFYGPTLYAGVVGDRSKRLVPAAQLDDANAAPDAVPIPVIVAADRSPDALLFTDEKGDTWLRTLPEPVKLVPFHDALDRYCEYFTFFTPEEWQAEREAYAAAREREMKRADATLDLFQPGEMQPERDHNFRGVQTNNGEAFGRKWRDARGEGAFMEFTMRVDPDVPAALAILYWGGETGDRRFRILVDGQKVGEETLNNNRPGKFYYAKYDVPNPEKKRFVTVRLDSPTNSWIGGFFEARTIKSDALDVLDD